jgi:membrane protein implicated in regulation of membrane protease activity
MLGLLLLVFGLLATVVGWRLVWRVRAVVRRISRPGDGARVPGWVLRAAPWRMIPVVGEAVLVWNRRARLAKLLALPVLAIGPLLTALGVVVLARDVHGFHASDATPLAIGAFLAAAVLVRRYLRRGRRPVERSVSAGQDRTW